MEFSELDTERILSSSQQWLDLEQKWGEPVDLDDATDTDPKGLASAPSSSSLNRTTFDSAKLIRRLKQFNAASRDFRDTLTDYEEFLGGIRRADGTSGYSVNDNLLRQSSVDISESRHRGSATSTLRRSHRLFDFGDMSSIDSCGVLHRLSGPADFTSALEPGDSWGCEGECRCGDFSEAVRRVGRELSYLERHGQPRTSRRRLERSDVRRVRWHNSTADRSIHC